LSKDNLSKLDEKMKLESDISVEDIVAKYDKESATRRTGKLLTKVIAVLLFVWGSWQLYTAFAGEWPTQLQRVTHLGFVLSAVFLLYPATAKGRDRFAWYDAVLAITGALIAAYYIWQYNGLALRAGMYTTMDVVVASIAVLLVLEAARRVVGLPILLVVLAFLLYAYFGQYMPSFLRHRGVRFERLMSYMLFTGEGILGVPLGVSSTFIFLFIMFGSFLEKTGIGKFFIDLGNAVAGGASGGPAKVAVISSALEGTISGSSVANTAGSGSFTIPMMKNLGYRPEFAGAVEASASTGGQIMPPVMGAAAFLMCEFLGVPYATIAKAAVIPALLYFTGVFLGVHFEARKHGLKGLPKDELPRLGTILLKQGQLLVPIIGIISFLSMGISAMKAALLGVILSVLAGSTARDYGMDWKEATVFESVSFRLLTGVIIATASGVYIAANLVKAPLLQLLAMMFIPLLGYLGMWYAASRSSAALGLASAMKRFAALILPIIEFTVVFVEMGDLTKAAISGVIVFFIVKAFEGEPKIHFTRLLEAVRDGSKAALGVGVACATAGMIVGVVTMTGLGLKIASNLVELANGELLLTMFFTMITSVILGMGVPTTANYVITSTIAAPAIITLIGQGQALAAHLFVFYFGIIADVTPPVALAAFTGAGIAKANPMKTGVEATRLSIAAWLVPYCFVYNTNLLMVNAGFFSFTTLFNLVTAVLGMFFIAVAVQGWYRTISPMWERLLAGVAGILLIGGAPFFHGVLEIFRWIGPVGRLVGDYKEFFYSIEGDFLVNGMGLAMVALIYLLQTKRHKVYGERSITEIKLMKAEN